MMKYMSKLISGILIAAFSMGVVAQTKLPPGWQSTLVKVTSDGKLVYYPDKQGNTIPDFSRVGYHHGDISIPHYPITKLYIQLKMGIIASIFKMQLMKYPVWSLIRLDIAEQFC